MRHLILLLSTLLVFGCSFKIAQQDDAEVITRIGVITTKQEASLDDIEQDSRNSTSVGGSILSDGGGSGVAIGVGVLLSSLLSSDSEPELVRYEVDLKDGGQYKIYLESRDFEIGDCVEISVHPDEDKHPPAMKRNPSAC